MAADQGSTAAAGATGVLRPVAGRERVRIPYRLPLVAFALAHLAALGAFASLVVDPWPFLATHLHPRVLSAVHALTLGWISLTAVGATWVVGHLALRMPLPAGKADGVALTLLLVGALGVVFHMGDGLWRGVGWSGLLSWIAVLWFSWRVLRGAARAGGPVVIRLHVAAAYVNLLVASSLGAAIAFAWLPAHLPPATALVLHAHVAVVGFAMTLAVGVGYRLLPMILPAAPPPESIMWTSLAALQLGVLALLARFVIAAPALMAVGALALGVGVAAFVVGVVHMLSHRRPAPRDLRRPDPAALLVLLSVLCLLGALALGLWLAARPAPASGPVVFAYGSLALVGFLGQLIAGVGFRLLPWLAWRHAFDATPPPDSGAGPGAWTLPPPPNAMGSPAARWVAVAGWITGVSCLTIGLLVGAVGLLRSGGVALASAVVAGLFQLGSVVHAGRTVGTRAHR
ncbi:MAG: hypothetical protein R3F56_13545 [Planctomycetota bacterium]